jgi:polar amino acid transport system substrate-binding protein
MFKKHLSLIATFFLIFVLCAPADGGTLEEIMKRRKITFGVKYDFPPFGYVDDSGAVKGFDIYVANYIAGKLGVVPEFKQVTTFDRVNALLKGDIDVIIASMTKTPYRAKYVSFTNTYFVDGQGILINKQSPLSNDLEGKIIAVIMDSTGERYVLSNTVNYKALALFRTYTDALEALKEGKVDVIVTDFSWCTAQQKDSGGELIAIEKTFSTELFGIGVRKDDRDLLKRLNELLSEMWKDGSYKRAYNEVFGKDPNFDILKLADQ